MTYAVLAILSDGCPPLKGRLPTCYSPVRRFTRQPKLPFSLDLHVLSPPLTFALSQDQTLHLILITFLHGVHLAVVSMTGYFFMCSVLASPLFSFQRPKHRFHPPRLGTLGAQPGPSPRPVKPSRRRDRAYTACFRGRQRLFRFSGTHLRQVPVPSRKQDQRRVAAHQ
jgi:hypothetical protein